MLQSLIRRAGDARVSFQESLRRQQPPKRDSVMKTFIIIAAIIGTTGAFLFPQSGGGCACPCPAAPACPPPAPCGGGCAKARGAKTVTPSDELELRAHLAGFSLDDPTEAVESHQAQLKLFENLGEEQSDPSNAAVAVEDHPELQGRKGGENVRFAPQAVDTDTTVAPVRVDESTAAPRTSSEVNSKETSATELDSKCNNAELKAIMLEAISENSSDSKHAINAAAEGKFGGNVDVICSRGHFSYLYSSNLFCEAAKGEVTCIAFRQSI
uniref:Ground-like domain-containing protein n=1 Tax=Panagrellus redivivus TaxID=6233 RepID=A0A7E4V0K9_PANRE